MWQVLSVLGGPFDWSGCENAEENHCASDWKMHAPLLRMHLQVQVEADIFVMCHSRRVQKFREDKRKLSQEHQSFIKLGGE